MELSRPPTDNLYKFVAIAGLTLFVVSTFIPLRESYELERRVARISARVEWAQLEERRMYPGSQLLLEIHNRLRTAGDSVSDSTRRTWREKAQAIASDLVEADGERRDGFVRRLTTISADNAELGVLAKQTKSLARIGRFGSALGAAITILGFWLWYVRVQKLQDAELRQRAEGAD